MKRSLLVLFVLLVAPAFAGSREVEANVRFTDGREVAVAAFLRAELQKTR